MAKLADQVSAGVLTMTDAVTQIISANIQLDSALNQIDQGLQTLEESRSAALSQAELLLQPEPAHHHRPARRPRTSPCPPDI
ncbi:MAG: hypothetical protein V8S97_03365 [Oscillospiraceae bacterium]